MIAQRAQVDDSRAKIRILSKTVFVCLVQQFIDRTSRFPGTDDAKVQDKRQDANFLTMSNPLINTNHILRLQMG